MNKELEDSFRSTLMKSLAPFGYSKKSGAIFSRDLSPGVLGCIGYLTSDTLRAIKVYVGVRFEYVERIYDELMKPFLVGPRSIPRGFPSVFRDIHDLKREQLTDPNSRLTERSYLTIEFRTVSGITDRLVGDVRQYGIPYIEFNALLSNAAATIIEQRGGGIGTVAYRLPIMYWILGRTDEAKAYVANIAAQRYPIGPYEKFADSLIARINAGAPRLPPIVH